MVDAGAEDSLVSMSAPGEGTPEGCSEASASALPRGPKVLGCWSLLLGPVGRSGFQAWGLSQPLGTVGLARFNLPLVILKASCHHFVAFCGVRNRSDSGVCLGQALQELLLRETGLTAGSASEGQRVECSRKGTGCGPS